MLASLIRYYFQGERPGMRAGRPPAPIDQELTALLYPDRLFFTSLLIQQQVQLADVSFWQGDIDFVKMKAAGIAGVIIRAGQRNWVDTRFKQNWTKAKAAGLPRGSYWFYDSREDPVKQADLWWSLLEGDVGELVIVPDLEESYGGPWGDARDFQTFVQRIQNRSGLPADRIAIYTGFYWWLKRVGNIAYFKQYKLWLAWYAPMSVVRVPAPWEESDLLFWQFTSSGPGSQYGVSSGEIDLNWYCCSPLHFNHYFRLADPEPPGDGGTVDYWELKSNTTSTRSIRSGPGIRHAKLTTNGDLFADRIAKAGATAEDVFTYTENVPDAGIPGGYAARAGDVWRKVYENDGRPVSGWIAKIHLGTTLLTETFRDMTPDPEPEPEPTPTLPEIPVTIVLGDDVAYEKQTIQVMLKPK